MGNCLSKELAAPCVLPDHAEQLGDNSYSIYINKRVHQAPLLVKERLSDEVYSG